MLIDDHTRMANQIADFFAPYPEDEAIAGVQNHIQKFWTPTMRKELLNADATQFAALHPLVQHAVGRIRERDQALGGGGAAS